MYAASASQWVEERRLLLPTFLIWQVYAASASQWVEKGRLRLYVGGGQPDFYPAHVAAEVSVEEGAALAACGE